MKSLLPLFLFFVGLFILLLIYYFFVYQKPETPLDVFLKLIRNNQQTILSFTYKKTPEGKYLNYYINNEFELEPRVEDFPVTFDTLPVEDNLHGKIFDIDNGFGVTGIEFPFRCPNGWIYKDGKCILEDICKPYDIDVYKGINYYQFNENFIPFNVSAETNFHKRLYVDCNDGSIKNCNRNELYIGGESISNKLNPCEPYDVCEDMLTMTTHNYPIFLGDVLDKNEFYVCRNGVSDRQRCPNNTQFSSIQNACLPVSRCFDKLDGTTIDTGDTNQFVLCRNGQENIVRCFHGVFNKNDDIIECRNSVCLTPRVIFQRFNERINIPVGRQFCMPDTNVPREFRCVIDPIIYDDDVTHLININFPTLKPPTKRFENFELPNVQYDMTTDECIPFVFNGTIIMNGTHNRILPSVPINIKTGMIDYSERLGEQEMYYKNYNLIMKYPGNEIVVTEKKLANFLTIPDLDFIEYVDDVRLVTGDSDGVNYLISGPIKSLLGANIQENPNGETQAGLFWNAFTQTFTSLEIAHSPMARLLLSSGDFNNSSYIFRYNIVIMTEEFFLNVLTPFGFCSFRIELNPGVNIHGTFLVVDEFPDYAEMELELQGPNTTMVVTDIYNDNYNPKHVAYFLKYIKILELLSPLNDVSINMEFSDFFQVDSTPLFKRDIIFE